MVHASHCSWKHRRSRVVVVEDVALEAKLFERSLRDGYAAIDTESGVDAALARVDSGARLVLADLELGHGQDGIELTRRIRTKAHPAYVNVVMITSHGTGRLEEAFAAGVDDFLTKPYEAHELLSRLRAAERVLDLESLLRVRAQELETALRRIDVTAASRALERAQTMLQSHVDFGGRSTRSRTPPRGKFTPRSGSPSRGGPGRGARGARWCSG